MATSWLIEKLFLLIPLVLSLSVHEWAHAAMAVRLGDDTPIRQGRYTLNPIAHIDPFGTILLPLLGVPFGWAKPVQWNPSRIRRDVPMRRALWMVSLAGPASNLVLAFVAALVFALSQLTGRFDPALSEILRQFFGVNVGLAVFNMLPIPPLDGSRIVDANVGRSFAPTWETIHRYAPFILLGIFIIPPIRDGLGTLVGLVGGVVTTVVGRITGTGI